MEKEVFLQINENFRIVNGEKDTFILQKFHCSKNGLVSWQNLSYHSSVFECLYSVLRRIPIKPGDTLETYVKRVEDMYKFLYIENIGGIIQKASEFK